MILIIGCDEDLSCSEYRFKIYSTNGDYLDTCKSSTLGRTRFSDCKNYEFIDAKKVLWKETIINVCHVPIDTD